MIKVFIRNNERGFSRTLGEFPPAQLWELVELVEKYGFELDGDKLDFVSAHFAHYPELERPEIVAEYDFQLDGGKLDFLPAYFPHYQKPKSGVTFEIVVSD